MPRTRRAPTVPEICTGLLTCTACAFVSACGSDSDRMVDTSSVSTMLMTRDDTPPGYTWNSVAEVLRDAGDDLGQQIDAEAASVKVEPDYCAALVPTSTSIIAELHDHGDTTGAVEFLPEDSNDPAVVDAVVSTSDDGDTASLASGRVSADRCSDFTRTRDDGSVTHFRADSSRASLASPDDTTVITVLSDSVTPGEELVTTITGTVDGVHFRIAASGVTDTQILTDLAEKQVRHIIEVMEGQD
ncbi:hypothetical protein [Corynebacterium provencense]|uniref:hypothetical protein n=1 Tax=Corynebacterium provencense TaxID=1737425 RepID=UPI000A86E699|nr:hypothetical protein [Corynebacterium provencense]